MSGKRITNNQIRLFMQSKKREKSIQTAAAQEWDSANDRHII